MGNIRKSAAIIVGMILATATPLSAGPCPPFYGVSPLVQDIRALFQGGNVWKAIESNDIKKVKKILASHPELADEPRYDRRLPLSLAPTAEMAEAIIAAGANVNKRAERAHCPLLSQAIWGNAEVVKVLIKKGAAVDTKGYMQGYTALHYAAKYNHLDVAKVLVEGGATVSGQKRGIFDGTALMTAARAGSEQVFAYLLRKDKNPQINEVLHIAAEYGGKRSIRNGNEAIIQLCLAAGADINSTVSGSTPLHKAAKLLAPSVVELLLEKGADVTARNNYGQTAIELIDTDYFRQYHPGLYEKTRAILTKYWDKTSPEERLPRPTPVQKPNSSSTIILNGENQKENADNFDGFIDF